MESISDFRNGAFILDLINSEASTIEASVESGQKLTNPHRGVMAGFLSVHNDPDTRSRVPGKCCFRDIRNISTNGDRARLDTSPSSLIARI